MWIQLKTHHQVEKVPIALYLFSLIFSFFQSLNLEMESQLCAGKCFFFPKAFCLTNKGQMLESDHIWKTHGKLSLQAPSPHLMRRKSFGRGDMLHVGSH